MPWFVHTEPGTENVRCQCSHMHTRVPDPKYPTRTLAVGARGYRIQHACTLCTCREHRSMVVDTRPQPANPVCACTHRHMRKPSPQYDTPTAKRGANGFTVSICAQCPCTRWRAAS